MMLIKITENNSISFPTKKTVFKLCILCNNLVIYINQICLPENLKCIQSKIPHTLFLSFQCTCTCIKVCTCSTPFFIFFENMFGLNLWRKKKKNIQVEELFSGWLLTKNFSLLDINLCLKFYLSTDIIHSEFSEYFFCFIKFNILTIYWNYLENQQSNDEVTFKKLWSTYHNSNSFSVTNKI